MFSIRSQASYCRLFRGPKDLRSRCRLRPVLSALEGRTLLSTYVVQNLNDSGTGSLRANIALAQNGDTIKFATGLTGTITLTSGPLTVQTGVTIKGPGADKLTVSGGGSSGEFLVESPYGTPPPPPILVNLSGITISGSDVNDPGILNFGATMSLQNVTVTANQGGGISNNFGIMTVTNSVISDNSSGVAGSAEVGGSGGGIFNSTSSTLNINNCLLRNNIALGESAIGGGLLSYFGSVLNVTGSTFQGNQAVGVYPAEGGAIHADPGSIVTISCTTFLNNSASNPAANGGLAQGGALDVDGTTTITGCWFSGDQAVAGSTNFGTSVAGGNAFGGAINNGGSLSLSNSAISGNQAIGGVGGGWGSGGAISNQGAVAFNLSNSVLTGNSAIGGAGGSYDFGYSGLGLGGAIDNEYTTATVENSSFVSNEAVGGAGADTGTQAGLGAGGAIENTGSTLTITGSVISSDQAIGGSGTDGATGGNGQGGGIDSDYGSTLSVAGGLIAANAARGGSSGGNGYGGGVSSFQSMATITDTLITLNFALGGSGGQGVGGGIYTSGGGATLNGKTKVVGNFASTSHNNLFNG